MPGTVSVGALVTARGREWVVLPESRPDENLLVLRPLGGTEDEKTGIYVGPGPDGKPFEDVQPAVFQLPNPDADLGNNLSCALLRDAVRLGFRSGAGPFRSLARLGVEPRPYQLVPLLMALKLDPVRLLIADDVGIGKTVEACLIARELLDRAEIRRLTVLCPPHLAEQWQRALRDQFHIDAELVLSGTAARLERTCHQTQSLFEKYPFTVVSTDYIKQDRRRLAFLRTCPELVIVDEAHTCSAGGRGASQRRHELLQELVQDARRNMVLVSATPHSGNEETFRSLLTLLDAAFSDLPEELSGEPNRKHREALARHLVQRRRGDLKAYLGTDTVFPERVTIDEVYSFHPEYKQLLDKALDWCRERVLDPTQNAHRQRVRWWSALALLRSIASSPAAAVATLRNRSPAEATDTASQADEEGSRAVLDLDDEGAEGVDVVAGALTNDEEAEKRFLRSLAAEAEALSGAKDGKLTKAVDAIERLVNEGRAPIVFCRFIPTVEYVAEHLRKRLEKKGVVVEAVTGSVPATERERRVEALGLNPKRVLVCTDCLSEGVNLQHAFDAVFHYDLSWNPTRHEQREGRVDRYGQPEPTVKAITFCGQNNAVDGLVLQVLIRKHQTIRKTLGVSVPVPMDARVIEDAIREGLLLRDRKNPDQLALFVPSIRQLDDSWGKAEAREKRSRTVFAQNQLLLAVNNEVAAELAAVRRAIGGDSDVRAFFTSSLRSLQARVASRGDLVDVGLHGRPRAVREALGLGEEFTVNFGGRPVRGAVALSRTHPAVEGLSAWILQTAIDSKVDGIGRRCGVIRTLDVETRTTVLLLRLRFHIVSQGRSGAEQPLLAEDLILAGFTGAPDKASWLAEEGVERLLVAAPAANILPEQARDHIRRVLDRFEALRDHLSGVADERGATLLDAHRRVRKATGTGIRTLKVDVHKPGDVLGVFVYLPAGGST